MLYYPLSDAVTSNFCSCKDNTCAMFLITKVKTVT